jgi:hypothetical protein
MVGGAVGRHRMMHTRTSLVFAKDSGREEKTPLLHSLRSAVLVCLDTTRFVRDGMTSGAAGARGGQAASYGRWPLATNMGHYNMDVNIKCSYL